MIPFLTAVSDSWIPDLGNHLWQSTLCIGVAWLLTLAFRKSPAWVRHVIWLTASIKFLLPFAWLVRAGNRLALPRSVSGPAGWYSTMVEVGQPFAPGTLPVVVPPGHMAKAPVFLHLLPAVLLAIWLAGFMVVLFVWWLSWRRISAVVRVATPAGTGREIETLRRVERSLGISRRIAVLLSRDRLEPGVVGIWRPVLLWPAGFRERLHDAESAAILAHEAWHVRRQDNLTAAIHMLVEAVFWFHPLVWWLGTRLVEERERACDEAVLSGGAERQLYAESILKTCEFCVESPLACAVGVSGGDLTKRVVLIMTHRPSTKLGLAARLVLVMIGLAALAGPVTYGMLKGSAPASKAAQDVPSLRFQSVSVKRNHTRENTSFHLSPEGLTVTNYVPGYLLEIAYAHEYGDLGLSQLRHDQLVGAPAWVDPLEASDFEGYDIDAKVPSALVATFGKDCGKDFFHGPCKYRGQMLSMLQSIFADQFKMKARLETRQVPAYDLLIAEGGPKFSKCPFATGLPPQKGPCPAGMVCPDECTSMPQFASWFSGVVDRPVIDRTTLEGSYYLRMQFPFSSSRESEVVKALIEERLGLKLKPTTGPVEYLVIDHIERPAEN